MAFQSGSYAKIKEVENKGNYSKAKISISKKDKARGSYVCTFVGWVNFVGDAHKCRPMVGQKIKIVNCGVTNGYLDREGNQAFSKSPNFTIFSYELQTDNANPVVGGSYNPYSGGDNADFSALADDVGLPF